MDKDHVFEEVKRMTSMDIVQVKDFSAAVKKKSQGKRMVIPFSIYTSSEALCKW